MTSRSLEVVCTLQIRWINARRGDVAFYPSSHACIHSSMGRTERICVEHLLLRHPDTAPLSRAHREALPRSLMALGRNADSEPPGPPSSSSRPVSTLRPAFHRVLAASKRSKVQDWGSALLWSPLLGHVPRIPPHPYRALDARSELLPRRGPLPGPAHAVSGHGARSPSGEVRAPLQAAAAHRPGPGTVAGRISQKLREESASSAPVIHHEGDRGILPSSFTASFPAS